MLRVAMVTTFPRSPADVFGGVESVSLHLVEGLAAHADLDVHIVAVGGEGTGTESWQAPACVVHRMPSVRPGSLTYWTITRRRVARRIRELAPDVVHVQGAAGLLGPRGPGPSVLTIHGIEEKHIPYAGGLLARLKVLVVGTVERRARRRYRHVILISPYIEQELRGQVAATMHPIDNPVAEGCFRLERREVPNRLLYAGLINVRKNVHGLIEAARRLRDAGVDFEWRLAGPAIMPRYFEDLQRDVARYGLGDRVRFLGKLSPQEVRAELAEAACVVLASFQETAPVVISEAMAAGVPVVATKVCGVPYMVTEGETGFLVEPTDMAGLADRVRQVLASEPLRRAFGRRAREVALQRFHPEVVARKTRAVYYEVAGRPVPRPAAPAAPRRD